ncbi:unnamed protein product [Closterium sp. Naga37s-1]|nr:unnamed protein product [Closterium sp. Naga37s-1]
MVSKRWASLLPIVRISAPADSPPRREDYYRHDDSPLPVPTLSAPALLRTLSRAPSVTSLTLGDGAVDFYDHDFLTSLLAACPKLTCLSLGEPRFTAAPPPFTISLASLDSFFRAAAPQLQELALLLPIEAPKLPDSITSLSSLRVLRLRSIKIQHLPDGLCHLPALQELQFSCSMLWTVPEDFGQLKALTHLSIVDSMNSARSLPDSLGDLSSLTSLCITFSCGRLPDSITALQQLRRLELRRYDSCDWPDGCEAWTRLEEVSLEKCSVRSFPPAWLKTLKRLTVRSCDNLKSLPIDDVVRDSPLRHLTFEGRLYPLPLHPLSQLTSLQRLKVSVIDLFRRFTTGDEAFPVGLFALPSLAHVSVDRVAWVEQGNAPKGVTIEGSFSSLPDTLGGLTSLQEAFLKSPVLASLPPSFCLLSHLHTLTITSSNCLVTLPADFGSLGALQRLSIHSCSRVHSLPDSFSSLASLVHLAITNCPKLSTLPHGFGSLSRLARLTITYCDSFTHLPASFPCLPSLRVASFSCCPRLQSLPAGMGLLPRLEVLHLRGCASLTNLPQSLRQARALRHVDVTDSGVAEEGGREDWCGTGVYIEWGRPGRLPTMWRLLR